MPVEHYLDHSFSKNSLLIINKANEIIKEYQAKGFILTLRQLYYQFVARGLIPNQQKEYKRLGSIINDARLAGLMDWQMIEDRTRHLEDLPKWNSPEELVEICAKQYRSDIWAMQPVRPEVWIEKDALAGVVEPVCQEFRIPYFACRGYSSQSEQWRAGKRFLQHRQAFQKIVVLHLGDHDPSGVDMTRDNKERIQMFLGHHRRYFELRRLALNWDQVELYNPPPNPAKLTDTRAVGYIQQFGDESWELDALDPTVIDTLIRNELNGLRDLALWNNVIEQEAVERHVLQNISINWEEVKATFG